MKSDESEKNILLSIKFKHFFSIFDFIFTIQKI